MKKLIKLRVVFMGTPRFAEEILKVLIANKYNIISVYTRSDKKTGRSDEVTKSAVKLLSEKNKLPVYEVEKFDAGVVGDLQSQKPDLIILAAYGKILPASVLKIPGFGAINIHASLLPKFRGPSPIQNALLEGVGETGSTIMLMNEGMDTGDILAQKRIKIGPDEMYESLLIRMAELSAKLLIETLPGWIERKIQPRPQNDSEAIYCQLIERSDGKVNWSHQAPAIYNRYRAFNPWPGIFTFWESNNYNQRLKLHRISLLADVPKNGRKIGEVFKADDGAAVQTGNGAIVLEEVQLEGKGKVPIRDFINGYPKFIGSFLK